MRAKSKVRSVTKDKDGIRVAFMTNDGYFTVADNEFSDFIVGMLDTAKARDEEVEFEYDQKLTITEIIPE